MLKVKIWTTEGAHEELRYLRPRRYMCGWSFERMMKYIKEELEWEDIPQESVDVIEIHNEREHWIQTFPREA